jgi:hypothetical protein
VDFIPRRDTLYTAWLNQLATQADALKVQLQLSNSQVTALQQAASQWATAYANHVAAVENARARAVGKAAVRRSTEETVRTICRIVQANPTVPEDAKRDIGLPVHDKEPTPVMPQTPTGLYVIGLENGANVLRWKRNGNKTGVQFIIEAKYSANAPWTQIGSTTRSSWMHEHQVPGVKVWYRVIATRTKFKSLPSTAATVYDGFGEEIQLAA